MKQKTLLSVSAAFQFLLGILSVQWQPSIATPLINPSLSYFEYLTCNWIVRPNPEDCRTYYQCNFGKSLLRDCPTGLYFNPVSNVCDWPINLKSLNHCQNRRVDQIKDEDTVVIDVNDESKNIQTEEIILRDSCQTPGSFAPVPNDCNSYYICNHGSYIKQSCGTGLHWNAKNLACDWPNRSGCGSTIPMTTNSPNFPSTTISPSIGSGSGTTSTLQTVTTTSTDSSTTFPIITNPSEYKIVCYFTDWAWYRPDAGKYIPENIDPTLCTHVVYSFGLLDGNEFVMKPADSWADIDNKFYEKVVALKKKGIKVSIAIGGWNDSAGSKYSTLVNDPRKRTKFIQSVVEYLEKYGFDGLDLDWEYPVCWQGNCNQGPSSDKDGFSSLIKELRLAMPKGALLSAAVSASKVVIDKAYDVPVMNKYLDWIGVMDYDFHGSWEKKTGHISPLYYTPGDEIPYFNTNYSINYYISQGADRKKLVMGVPLYGQSFTLADAANNGLNAVSYGPGQAGPYTRQGGVLAYYEICSQIKSGGWKVVQDPNGTIGPYAFKGTQWVSYDDVPMVRRKAMYIRDMGLGGGMIWALDFDDFGNICGTGKYPLLSQLKNMLLK